MKKQWNKDMHDRLKDFPKKAPEGLLDDIKSEMLRRGLSSAPATRRRMMPGIFFRVASVAAVIALLFGLSHLFQQGEVPVSLPEMGRTLPLTEDEGTPSPQEETTGSLPISPTTKRPVAKAIVKTNTLSEHFPEETLIEEKTESEEEKQDTLTRQTPVPPKKAEASHKQKQWTYPASPHKKRPSFDVAIYYSGLMAQGDLNLSRQTYSNTNLNSTESSPEKNKDSTSTDIRGISRAVNRSFSRRKSAEKAMHHIPVRMGISVRYYLNERWNLQSGLTYSYLASDLSYNGFDTSYETKQKLHYIGIPLQIGYRIWENERFRNYISAGGQVEKLVSGKATTHYSLDNGSTGTLIEDISDNRLLFSALASVGFEYALGKDFSLYAEPGIHYYFKNGNGLKTHYNEQPLNFNITVGFRFHWKK